MDFFEITIRVRQGCILSPLLFLVALDDVMGPTGVHPGRSIHRIDRSYLGHLDFADGITLLVEDELKRQHAMTFPDEEANIVVPRISPKKSKITHVKSTVPTRGIVPRQQRLEEVERFSSLGGVIIQNGGAEVDSIICPICYIAWILSLIHI